MTSPLRQFYPQRRNNGTSPAGEASDPLASDGLLSRELFVRTLYVERKRTERSGRSFVLMMLESSKLLKRQGERAALHNVLLALSHSSRDTDARGWYKEGSTIGVIFTELGADVDGRGVAAALLTKVTTALTASLTISQINEIRLTFHVFPEDLDRQGESGDKKSKFYDDLLYETAPKPLPRAAKRFMDIAGSLFALLFG